MNEKQHKFWRQYTDHLNLKSKLYWEECSYILLVTLMSLYHFIKGDHLKEEKGSPSAPYHMLFMMSVLGMCLPAQHFLFPTDPIFPPVNSRSFGTDLTKQYKRWTQKPRTANESLNSPAGGLVQARVQARPVRNFGLDRYVTQHIFLFFLRQLANKKVQTNIVIKKEYYSTEFCLPSTTILFFSSLHFSVFPPHPNPSDNGLRKLSTEFLGYHHEAES